MIFNIKISLFIICPCDMKVTLYNFCLCLQIKNPQMEAKFVLELGQKVVHLFVCCFNIQLWSCVMMEVVSGFYTRGQ